MACCRAQYASPFFGESLFPVKKRFDLIAEPGRDAANLLQLLDYTFQQVRVADDFLDGAEVIGDSYLSSLATVIFPHVGPSF